MNHLIITLQATMMAFNLTRVDNYARSHRFPTQSGITGLLANALGYERTEYRKRQDLQDRLIFAARTDRDQPRTLLEYQTAEIRKDQAAWTPTGKPELRKGGNYQVQLLHQHYLQDTAFTVALRLEPQDGYPDLQDLARALIHPERPLFLGRASCIPTTRILAGTQEAPTALAALRRWPMEEPSPEPGYKSYGKPFRERPGTEPRIRITWPPGEGDPQVTNQRELMIPDVRNWQTGVHTGERRVLEADLPWSEFVIEERPDGPGETPNLDHTPR